MMTGMTTPRPSSDDTFTSPGLLHVSKAALQFARDFRDAVQSGQAGDWIVVFDWAESVSLKRGADEPYEDIGACLTMGVYRRHEVPKEFVQRQDDVAFVVSIPENVWRASVGRLIDIDETKPFKLVLR
jgi:hypothetical protein